MDIFTPSPGVIYKFSFEDGYTYFDGAYKVAKVMSYDEYIADDGDIINDFYVPAFTARLNGEEELDMVDVNNTFLNDQEYIRSHKILKLLPPEDNTEDNDGVFVSMYYIKETPDFNIKKYLKFGLVTYIGVTDEPSVLDNMRDMIKMHVDSTTGIDSDPQFVSVGEEWLTDDEYQEVLNNRNEIVKNSINYFTESVKLQKEVSTYKDQINAYEQVISQLSEDVHIAYARVLDSLNIYRNNVGKFDTYLDELKRHLDTIPASTIESLSEDVSTLKSAIQGLEEIING